jgi:hypothetical protein
LTNAPLYTGRTAFDGRTAPLGQTAGGGSMALSNRAGSRLAA